MTNGNFRRNLIYSFPTGPAVNLSVDTPVLRNILIVESTVGDSYIWMNDNKLEFYSQGWLKLYLPVTGDTEVYFSSGVVVKDSTGVVFTFATGNEIGLYESDLSILNNGNLVGKI